MVILVFSFVIQKLMLEYMVKIKNTPQEDGSLFDPKMNSFNHYAYGSIGAWMYQEIGGLKIDDVRPIIITNTNEKIESIEQSAEGEASKGELLFTCNLKKYKRGRVD